MPKEGKLRKVGSFYQRYDGYKWKAQAMPAPEKPSVDKAFSDHPSCHTCDNYILSDETRCDIGNRVIRNDDYCSSHSDLTKD